MALSKAWHLSISTITSMSLVPGWREELFVGVIVEFG